MAYPYDSACDTHANMHHPHTNIIGLGDSSSWRLPMLNREQYLFVAPLFLPLLAPLIGVKDILEKKSGTSALMGIARFISITILVGTMQYWIFREYCGLSMGWSLLSIWLRRAPYFIPYIHVNIFQHIGLCMYTNDNRPDRLTQMSTGALNLPRTSWLDYNFGHSLISCHVEHHLFTKLTDNMCKKVKPTVQKYFNDNGLQYNEQNYMKRLKLFYYDYDRLMVNAPNITHFVAVR